MGWRISCVTTVRYAVEQRRCPKRGLRRAALDIYMAVRRCAVGCSVVFVHFVLVFSMASTEAHVDDHVALDFEIWMACNPWIVELSPVSVRVFFAG